MVLLLLQIEKKNTKRITEAGCTITC